MRRAFAVSTARLRILMEAFRGEMRRGLNGKPSSLRMLPAYVDRPTGRERGTFLALDLGGTNVRVLQVDLPGDGRLPVCAEDRFVLSRDKVTADGSVLFGALARFIGRFLRERRLSGRLPLGFTFSFPP